MNADLSGYTALAALALSVYSTFITLRFNRRQEELIALQKERERSAIAAAKQADVGASFVSLGKDSHRLRVFNRGAHVARDVRIEFPEGNEIVQQRDIDGKFPMATLDRHQSVDVLAGFYLSSPSKLAVKLTWVDGDDEERSKVLHLTR